MAFVRKTVLSDLIFGGGWYEDFLQQNAIYNFLVEIFSLLFSLSANREGDFLITNFQEIGRALIKPK